MLTKREQFYIDTLLPEFNITTIVERNILSHESRLLQGATRSRKLASGEIAKTVKKIYKYNLLGEFIREYLSVKEACLDSDISHSSICRYLNKQYTRAGQFLWSFEYVDYLPIHIKPKRCLNKLYKKVYVYDIESKTNIMVFNSLQECGKYYNVNPSTISESIKKFRIFRRKYRLLFKPA